MIAVIHKLKYGFYQTFNFNQPETESKNYYTQAPNMLSSGYDVHHMCLFCMLNFKIFVKKDKNTKKGKNACSFWLKIFETSCKKGQQWIFNFKFIQKRAKMIKESTLHGICLLLCLLCAFFAFSTSKFIHFPPKIEIRNFFSNSQI